MNDVQDPEAITQEAAFDSAHHFNGEKLEPFSFARQAAAQRMKTMGSGLETDVLVVYLCTQPSAVIDAARGPDGESAFREAMSAWADQHKITLRSKSAKEVKRIADEIWRALDTSDSEPDLKKSHKLGDPKEHRPAEPPNTSPKSRPSSMAA